MFVKFDNKYNFKLFCELHQSPDNVEQYCFNDARDAPNKALDAP